MHHAMHKGRVAVSFTASGMADYAAVLIHNFKQLIFHINIHECLSAYFKKAVLTAIKGC